MCRCEIGFRSSVSKVFNSALPHRFHFPLAPIFRFLFVFPPHLLLLLLFFPFLLLTARSVCTFLKPLLILLSHTALSVLSVCGFHFTNQFLDTNKTNKQTNNQTTEKNGRLVQERSRDRQNKHVLYSCLRTSQFVCSVIVFDC
ncbi:hypothetical protein K457DRAFT_476206 [Linnemannia elongata AG-77]|uniref:Transmembrane protein n=1 Tax=Linnemannia elongata AG-77 TaxID=1314771 RepID=A0A197JXJ2_9FUNG|nr:hypothetical protein K457DRAFT_476206 [Linnemannia elongata AG-77]